MEKKQRQHPSEKTDAFFSKGRCEYCGGTFEEQVWISIHRGGRGNKDSVLLTCHRCDVPGTCDVKINDLMEDPVQWLVYFSERSRVSDETASRFVDVLRKVNEFVGWRQSRSRIG